MYSTPHTLVNGLRGSTDTCQRCGGRNSQAVTHSPTMTTYATSLPGVDSSKSNDEPDTEGIPYNLDLEEDNQTESPFGKYDNKDEPYVWPSIYDEVDNMFDVTCLIYAMAELRQRATDGRIDDPRVLQLPLTALEVLEVVQDNQEHLKDTKFGNAFYLELLETMAKKQQKIRASTRNVITERMHSRLVAFNDCNYQEEMVYGIAVNPSLKRITVCFRGSITRMDWTMDRETFMRKIDNPVHETKNHAGPMLRIHQGFYDYLCAPLQRIWQKAMENGAKSNSEKPGEVDGRLSQYQKMLQQLLLPLLEECPGYKIYVTGHSLGAALATLFAFLLAAEPDSSIPKPVTCISFGSPYVGDKAFRRVHQSLEGSGKLRHLRITNHQDLVTLIPFASFRWKVWDSDAHVGAFFKHVGMNLRFFAQNKSTLSYDIIYPKVLPKRSFAGIQDKWKRLWSYSLCSNCSFDFAVLFTHGHYEYQRRLDDNSDTLQFMYLNDLYSNKDIVGHLIDDFDKRMMVNGG